MPIEKLIIPSLAAAKDYIGRKMGPTEWMPVTQEQIQAFSEVTGDDQWIHVDVDRASRESPWKGTIAHGYLTLSLAPVLLSQVLDVQGWKTAVNTGLDKLRFSAPVPSGSRIRLRANIKDVREIPKDGIRMTLWIRIEVEGSSKAALIANLNYVYF